MKKKILLVSHNFSYTGAPLVLFQLAKGLRDRGYDVWAAGYPSSVADSKQQAVIGLYRDFVDAGIPTMMCECAIPTVERIKPDLVICNTLLTHWAVSAVRDRGIPTLWWLHEGPWARQQLWHDHMLLAFKDANRLVVSTNYLWKHYVAVPDLINTPFSIIKYGIPQTGEPIYHSQVGYAGEPPPLLFLVAGTVEWRKGQDIALDAWEEVKPEKAKLTIIGGGWDTKYGKEISARAAKLPNVSVHLPIYQADWTSYLDLHDVVLVPSRDEGGYAQVLLQAQERGKLVVAQDNLGHKEQMRHGLLYNNQVGLIGAIKHIIAHPEMIEQFGRQEREWVHKNNSIVEHLDKWEQLIGEVCD